MDIIDDEFKRDINYISRQIHIKNECYDELMSLVAEMSKYCPHNIVEYASKELWKINDKFCEVRQYRIQ